jgi:uncharacterized protein
MSGEVECGRRPSRTGLLVIQPTPFCNIDCSYCYLPHRTNKKRMTLEAAERIFERLFRFPTIENTVDLVWHAGEPMVLPASYYADMFALIERLAGPKLEVRHAFQTNATLLTDEWCELIKKWRVNIGLSIDGPAEFHDLNRKYRSGKGSFAAAHRGLQLVKKHGLPFHVISVLTVASLQQPDKMFDFYDREDINEICFNIEEKEGVNAESEVVDSPRFEALYRAFLVRMFERATQQRKNMIIREFEIPFLFIQGYGHGINNPQTDPFGIISVDSDGNMSTFSPEMLGLEHKAYDSFSFGNILADDFETISRRIEDSKIYADIRSGVQKCEKECQYFKLCGGGAPVNKIYENNSADSTETVYCRSYQIGIDVVLDMIERVPAGAAELLDKPRPASERHMVQI